jgi:hypothetical protein
VSYGIESRQQTSEGHQEALQADSQRQTPGTRPHSAQINYGELDAVRLLGGRLILRALALEQEYRRPLSAEVELAPGELKNPARSQYRRKTDESQEAE